MTTNPKVLRLARKIVAANIDAWGWGPLEEIEGLSEHKLAIDAAITAIEQTTELLAETSRRKAQIHHRIAAENGHLKEGHLALSSAYITAAEEAERYGHLRQTEKDKSNE